MPRQAASFGVAFAVLAAAESSVNAQRIYWTDAGGVRRAYLDGSNPEFVVPGTYGGIALDLIEGKIYFLGAPGKIQRADLDGNDVQDVVSVNVHFVQSIALDLLHRKIYWTDSWWVKSESILVGGVFRADLDDGANLEDVLPYVSESQFRGIAVDPDAGYLYWTFWAWYLQGILRRTLDGPPTEELITEGVEDPYGLALDTVGGKLYWADPGRGQILSANLDGSEPGPILDHLVLPEQIALDLRRGKVYWTEGRDLRVYRANLDGSAPELVLPPQPKYPFAVAIDHRVYFDCDGTGQLDLDDQSPFVDCLLGPGSDVANPCLCADENGDRDVDLADFAVLQRTMGAE